MNRLAELNARITDFERSYPNCVNGRGISPGGSFLLTLLLFAVLGGALFLWMWEDSKEHRAKYHIAESADDIQVLLVTSGAMAGAGVVAGLIMAAAKAAHNSRCDEYTTLAEEKATILRRNSKSEKTGGLTDAGAALLERRRMQETASASNKESEQNRFSKVGDLATNGTRSKTVAEDEADRRAKEGAKGALLSILSLALVIGGVLFFFSSCKNEASTTGERFKKAWGVLYGK